LPGCRFRSATQAAGLNATEWYALSQVGLAGSLTSGELASRTGMSTGATTRLIDRLERAGYVRRTIDPADRRKVVVEVVQVDLLFDYFAHAAPAYREATEESGGGVAVGAHPATPPVGSADGEVRGE
jgi:hypothetical protein